MGEQASGKEACKLCGIDGSKKRQGRCLRGLVVCCKISRGLQICERWLQLLRRDASAQQRLNKVTMATTRHPATRLTIVGISRCFGMDGEWDIFGPFLTTSQRSKGTRFLLPEFYVGPLVPVM